MNSWEGEPMKKKTIKNKNLKPAPTFKNEAAERHFWATHDSTEYIDWNKAKSVILPNLKPSTETISLRLPQRLLIDIKSLASVRDIPYQSFIKIILSDGVESFAYHPNRRVTKK